jgi:ATP-binding cassette subfamily B protein
MAIEGVGFVASAYRKLFSDPYGTPSLIRRLLRDHALPHWPSYAFTYALMGVVAACTAIYTYMLGLAVNQTYFQQNYKGVAIVCAGTVLVFVVRGLAYYGQAVLLARIGNQISADVQKRMFDKVLRHSVGFFSQAHSSSFMAQLTYGCMGVAMILNLLITATGRDVLLLISLVVLMFHEDPLLAAVALIVVPAAMMFLRDMVKRVREQAMAQYAGGANVLMMLQDTLQGMRVVKAFRLENTIRRFVNDGIDNNQRLADKMAALGNRPTPIMEMLGGFAVAAIFVYAAIRMINGSATPGGYVAFIAAFLLAYEPAKRLGRLNIELANYLAPAQLLFSFLDSPATEPDDSDRPALRVEVGSIEFDNVDFAYRPGEPVIRGVSFIAEAGKRTALVGASGGGKTTMFSLMLRFYEPERGAILIDGQNVAACSRASLRDAIAYVGQDTFLFSSTIRDNIACGKTDVSDDEIVAAAKAAYLHDFIASLPAGYNTPVGEQGTTLSGGERQRVAIARALIKDASIILLDEATASLDSESELHVRKAIAALCRGRTTMIIAHRLHTITHADKILVVDNGAVVEEGLHAELLRRNGRYAMFYRLQLAKDEGPADLIEENDTQRNGSSRPAPGPTREPPQLAVRV